MKTKPLPSLLFFVGKTNPNYPNALAVYTKLSSTFFERQKVKCIAHQSIQDQLLGERHADFIKILEFPDCESLHKLLNHDEYKTLIPYRDKAFSTLDIYSITPGVKALALTNFKYLFVTIAQKKKNYKVALERYIKSAHKLAPLFGIYPIIEAKYPVYEHLFGSFDASFITYSYADKKKNVKHFFESDDFKTLLPIREKALGSANTYLLK